MSLLSLSLSFLLAVPATAPAFPPAGIAGPALFWLDGSGAFAGDYFADGCTPDSFTATPGGSATISIAGDFNAPFGLFLAPSASSCVSIPGIGGTLGLDGPIVQIASGALTEFSMNPVLPSGLIGLPVTVPTNLPAGFSFALQAVGFGWSEARLTGVIEVTIG